MQLTNTTDYAIRIVCYLAIKKYCCNIKIGLSKNMLSIVLIRCLLIATAMAEGKEQLALCMETIACTGIRISGLKYFTVERIKRGNIEQKNIRSTT